ncbi:MAG TPA: UDP-N-acetylglucosamine 2-epimerase (non-hydrolyzing) [Ignavibacteriaceae bacterium]|nr:UDP-N-acetylglucosamine 2-epimerase (non-hydrolyzing) [Ignavibacteriaceae bacterium]
MKILTVVGARPNFMKVAPIHKALQKYKKSVTHLICHTGQHYDTNMSEIFFKQLELPVPDYFLGIGSGSHAEQTGRIMIEFEKLLIKENPVLVIVVGDVNSTIACALTAKKLHIKVAHVEAGLRSFDRDMPEEVNRILTDSISDYLFVTEKSGLVNLKNEGIDKGKVFFVGNCMIDSLISILKLTKKTNILKKYELNQNDYIIVTMHRPSNVDSETRLTGLVKLLNSLSVHRKIIFPIHPRTRKNLEGFGLLEKVNENIFLTNPIGYIDFISLLEKSELILTDSGGIQEESTYLGVQCITLRTSTERPSTVDEGTNQLVGGDFKKAGEAVLNVIGGHKKIGTVPAFWDGKAAERICEILASELNY